jgi:hypothetical protein
MCSTRKKIGLDQEAVGLLPFRSNGGDTGA